MVIVLNIHNVVDGDHYDFYNHNDGWNDHGVCHSTYHDDDDGTYDDGTYDDGTYDDDNDDDDDDVCYKSNHTRKNNHNYKSNHNCNDNCKSNHNYKNNHNDLDNNSCSGCKLDHDQTDIDYKIYHDCIHFDCTSCKSDGDSNNGPYIVIL